MTISLFWKLMHYASREQKKYQHKWWKNDTVLRMAFTVREREKKKRSTVLQSFSCRYLWYYLVTDTVARLRCLNNLYYQFCIIMSLQYTAEQASPVQELRKAFNYFWTVFLFVLKTDTIQVSLCKIKLTASIKQIFYFQLLGQIRSFFVLR